MRKTFCKKGIALLMLVALCLSLCSCDALDALREEHAVWAEGGILYQGQLYQSVDSDGSNLNYNYTNQYFVKVTQPDVPLLLSPLFSSAFCANEDKTIISGTESQWYIRADLMEDYEDGRKNGIHYTHLGFDYWDTELGENTDYILSTYERQQLMDCRPGSVSTDFKPDAELALFEQSGDGLFRRGDRYSVARSGEQYYFVEFDEELVRTYVCPASAEATEIIKTFFEKAPGNMAYSYQFN